MAAYQKLIIYYFSGTGNSRNVALWLSNVAKENSIESRLINIGQIDRLTIEQPDPEALVAFISPIHGFNYPPVMMHFIMRFPKGRNKVLLMNTRAGMLIGKWNVPGLTGIAFYFSALFLKLKGYSIKAMFPVDLPSNWISVHPGLNERTVKYLHEKNQEKVYRFARKVLNGGSDFRGIREIIQDALVAPISLGYYFMGRFLFAKTYFASSDCDNCGLCIKNCPVKAIIKVDNRPFWTFNCESCMRCMSNCPKQAIETGHGFIAGFMLLFNTFFIVLFYKYLELYFFRIENEMVRFVVETSLFLSMLALSYRLIHYCMRFRFFERMMVYTSLTKYKFWGRRYKALKER
jgi:Pyruvate/2-oxoacid:ferredoxin oxidoreductase delta subunit/flavodoxin